MYSCSKKVGITKKNLANTMNTKPTIDLNISTTQIEESFTNSCENPPEKNLPIFQGAPSFDLNRDPDGDGFTNDQVYGNSSAIELDLNKLPYSFAEEGTSQVEREVMKRKVLTNDERYQIYLALLERSVNGKLKKTTTRDVASVFSVPMRTVQRIWKRSFENVNNGVPNVSHRRTKNCGRKRIEINMEQFWNIPVQQRATLRTAAKAMNVSTSVLYRNLKSYASSRNSNTIKPLLTRYNRKD